MVRTLTWLGAIALTLPLAYGQSLITETHTPDELEIELLAVRFVMNSSGSGTLTIDDINPLASRPKSPGVWRHPTLNLSLDPAVPQGLFDYQWNTVYSSLTGTAGIYNGIITIVRGKGALVWVRFKIHEDLGLDGLTISMMGSGSRSTPWKKRRVASVMHTNGNALNDPAVSADVVAAVEYVSSVQSNDEDNPLSGGVVRFSTGKAVEERVEGIKVGQEHDAEGDVYVTYHHSVGSDGSPQNTMVVRRECNAVAHGQIKLENALDPIDTTVPVGTSADVLNYSFDAAIRFGPGTTLDLPPRVMDTNKIVFHVDVRSAVVYGDAKLRNLERVIHY